MALSESLQKAAGRNQELLTTLNQTDHAPADLKQNKSYIEDLEAQLKKTDKELKHLHRVTEDERKDHLKYKESTFKRYAHKMSGRSDKFQSKQEKEEREFMEAWQKERGTQESRAELQKALDKAKSDKESLEKDAQRHEQAQTELDQLYTSIFSGPTPGVPGEDEVENRLQSCKQQLEQTQSQLNAESRACEALDRANNKLQQADEEMKSALHHSKVDMWVGGTFTDMMERDALSKAQVNVMESLRQMDEAQRCQPQIPALHDINIDNGHIISDVFFDNIFTDMAQHDRIKSSDDQLQKALRQLQDMIAEQRQRFQAVEQSSRSAKRDVDATRQELQGIRAQAFERFAGNGGGAPPPY